MSLHSRTAIRRTSSEPSSPSEGVDQILNVTNLDPSAPGNAMLEVALQGRTSAAIASRSL